jgi:hypothetical protein
MGRVTAAITFLVVAVIATTGQVGATPSLHSRLLTISQMPIGWTVNNNPPAGERWQGFGLGFLPSLMKVGTAGITSAAGTVFDDAGSPPELTERIVVTKEAKYFLDKLASVFTAHPTLKAGTTSAKFSSMSFPVYGQSSDAYRIKIELPAVGGGSVAEYGYVLFARANTFVLALVETGTTTAPMLSQFLSFSRKAVARL